MLTLLFFRTGDRPVHAAGPVPFVRVAGTSLKVGPDNQNLGHHRGGFWRVAGQDTPKFLVTGSGPLLLEAGTRRNSQRSGKLGRVLANWSSSTGRSIRVQETLLLKPALSTNARVALWYLYSDGSLHPTLLLEENHFAESRAPANATSTAGSLRTSCVACDSTSRTYVARPNPRYEALWPLEPSFRTGLEFDRDMHSAVEFSSRRRF